MIQGNDPLPDSFALPFVDEHDDERSSVFPFQLKAVPKLLSRLGPVFVQVMPHLLHHLGVDANAKALSATAAAAGGRQGPGAGTLSPAITGECMDWGTLAVYTCPDSCASKPPRSESGPSASGGEGVQDGKGVDALVVGYVDEFGWRQPPP